MVVPKRDAVPVTSVIPISGENHGGLSPEIDETNKNSTDRQVCSAWDNSAMPEFTRYHSAIPLAHFRSAETVRSPHIYTAGGRIFLGHFLFIRSSLSATKNPVK